MKLPHTVEYTDSVAGGDARMFRIRINPKYQFDKGLMAHEYEHVKQWYLTLLFAVPLLLAGYFYNVNFYIYAVIVPFIYGLMYNLKAFRSFVEVLCYRKQLAHYETDKTEWAAKVLAEKYDLGITAKQAEKLLRG